MLSLLSRLLSWTFYPTLKLALCCMFNKFIISNLLVPITNTLRFYIFYILYNISYQIFAFSAIGTGFNGKCVSDNPHEFICPIIIWNCKIYLTFIMRGSSIFFRSGSIYFFIFAISYMYCMGITPFSTWPGKGVNFYISAPLWRNQLVYGGFTINLKVLSVNAVSFTFIGTSGRIWEVILLNYSQNFIIFTPNGPKAWPIFGFGFAAPANTLKFTVAILKLTYLCMPWILN